MLEVNGLNVAYGRARVLRDLSLTVRAGEILCLLGRNGAGKTTTMKAIMGLLPLMSGRVVLDGQVVSDLPPHQVPRTGIGYIPQGRGLFADLTVAQNLQIGLMVRKSGTQVLDDVLDLFPRLRERLHQRAQTLSGGEQQMLATARALCLEPRVLLLDEPTEGLQPSMIEAIREVIVMMRARGVAVLLVEQRVDAVLSVADRVAFIENGRNLETLDAARLRADPAILERHLGV
ncbi:ABC transporter ATP-binding protein [Rhodobacteraceae bacterium F11138]|nr:ABC transporter ATP-binding protein [Rhodobacteraceae bacterium F11138]